MIDENIQLLLDEAEDGMKKTLLWLQSELHSVRAGRATPSMIENVRIDYYGSQTPLNQIASISATQPDLLVVQPWDRSVLSDIEKAIQKSELSVNPNNDGKVIRINIPPLTEERRQELVKVAKNKGEQCRVSIRNIRREVIEKLRTAEKSGDLPEDDRHRGEKEAQELTDKFITEIGQTIAVKEEEIMTV